MSRITFGHIPFGRCQRSQLRFQTGEGTALNRENGLGPLHLMEEPDLPTLAKDGLQAERSLTRKLPKLTFTVASRPGRRRAAAKTGIR